MKRLLARLLPLAAMLAFASPAWAGEMTVRGTAIAPDAPGRLSTMTGRPHASVRRCPTMRATVSAIPPAVNATIIRTVRLG